MNSTRPRWSPNVKITVALLMLAFGLYLLTRFRAVVAPMILAAILAYVLFPLATLIQARLRIHRALATALVYLLLTAGLALLGRLVVPPLAAQASALRIGIQNFAAQTESLASQDYNIAGLIFNGQDVYASLSGSVQGLLQPVMAQSLVVAVDVVASLVWVIFILVVAFYLIKDSERLRVWFEGLVPPDYLPDFIRLRIEISQIWASFFRGQIILAGVVALIWSTICLALGLPYGLALGALAGLLEFLPSLGHGIWLATAGLTVLFGGSNWLPLPAWGVALIVVGLHLFFQQFDLNYLIPRIVGRSVSLSPLVVILGVVAGGLLGGVLGILLAAPTIASVRVLARYIYANLLDLEPFPSAAPLIELLPPPNPRWWRGAHSAQDPEGIKDP
jgi:predicted PurR-regulated permease PerM